SRRSGKALPGARPNPAVRLSPSATKRSVPAAAACEAAARTAAKASAWTGRRKRPYEVHTALRRSINGFSRGRDARRRSQSRPRRGARAYPARGLPDNRQGRGGGNRRRLRLGQIDAADDHGRPRAAGQRRGRDRRGEARAHERGRARAVSRAAHRHRVPVLSPDPDHDRARKCRGAARARRRTRRARARKGRARRGRPRGPALSLSRAALGGRAAARRAGARAGAPPLAPDRGRADRQSRRGDRAGDHRAHLQSAGAARRDARARHPRFRARLAVRPGDRHALGQDRAGAGAGDASGMNAPAGFATPSSRAPILRFALRDLRGGFKGLRIFLLAIALGVAAIVGVESLARALNDGLGGEGRVILGGDASFSLIHRRLSADERNFLEAHGSLSTIATMRGMARAASGDAALIEIKAVEPSWPRLGAAVFAPPMPLEEALGEKDGVFGVAVEDALLARLNLKLGDVIRIGEASFAL